MEEIFIEGLEVVGDLLVAATVGIVAAVAAHLFISKYEETIRVWVGKNLRNHPGVVRVVVRALQVNHHLNKAVRVRINNAVYVLVQMLGVKSSKVAEAMTSPTVNIPQHEETTILSPEQLARFSGYTISVSQNESEESLLQKGLLPEKAARGMGLIDKQATVKGMYEVCGESKVMELRQTA